MITKFEQIQLGKIILIFCFANLGMAFSQNAIPASEAQEQIQKLIDLGREYRSKNRDSSIVFYEGALNLSQENHDTDRLAKSALELSNLYSNKGNLDKGKYHVQLALNTILEHQLEDLLPGAYLDMGILYRRVGQLDSAFICFTQAERAFKAINEEYEKWKVHANFALLYVDKKELDKAGQQYEKAWSIIESGDSRMDKGYMLYILGNHYFEVENFEKFALFSQKWEDFQRESGRGAKIISDPDHAGTYAVFSKKDPATITRLQKAIEYQKAAGEELIVGSWQQTLGMLLLQNGQKEPALKVLLDSEKSLHKINTRTSLANTYFMIYHLYKEKQNLKSALQYHEKYLALKDSLRQEDLMKNLAELETKYETDKKEKEIELLNSENQIQELKFEKVARQNLFIFIGLFVTLVFAGLLLYFYRQKQKDNVIISKALKEKELLLKEIHHRVKNNLQIISSLLSLQSRFIEDENALEAIKEGRDRVKSMALIHQNLYQEDNLMGIEIQSYFDKLTKSLFDSYNISPERIQLETDIENLQLDVDIVIPLGLIVNELVSNALKHAFPNERNGVIKVSLKELQNRLQLQVADNGVGWKKELVPELSDSFGFKLIHAFKNKLEADLEIESKGGASITMWIEEYDKAA